MKIDFKKVYEERIIEIDTQIKRAIYRKSWGLKKSLEYEREDILGTLKTMRDRECIR